MSDPVAVEFNLNTQMLLLSKRSVWLSDGSMGFGQEIDAAFSEGMLTGNIPVTLATYLFSECLGFQLLFLR